MYKKLIYYLTHVVVIIKLIVVRVKVKKMLRILAPMLKVIACSDITDLSTGSCEQATMASII